MKKNICLLLVVGLLTQPALFAKTIYSKLADHYLTSLDKPIKKKGKTKKAKKRQVKILTAYEKHKLAYNILNEHGNQKDLVDDICDEDTWRDLELFYGPASIKELSLFNQINHTETTFGSIALQRILATPTTDIKCLQKRQAIVKELVQNEQLLDELTTLLREFKQRENSLFSLWDKSNKLTQAEKTALSLQVSKILNKSTLCLEAMNDLYDLSKIILLLLPVITIAFSTTISFFITSRKSLMYKYVKLSQPDMTEEVFNHIYKEQKLHIAIPITSFILATAFVLLASPLFLYISYQGYSDLSTKIRLRKFIHKKMIDLAKMAKNLKHINVLIKRNKTLQKLLPLQTIHALQTENKQTRKILQTLNKSTFAGPPTLWSLQGRIYATHTSIVDGKNNFAAALETLGTIDAYCSIAKLYKKFQDQPVTYCFPRYIESNSTRLHADTFWFPTLLHSLKAEQIRTNSIDMGKKSLQNIILTGPNMGGKSTILKGLTTTALFAQTLGIAPAKSLAITPLDKIQTYLNIVDNSALGVSLFKANLLKAKDLINNAQKVKKGLFIKDEPFNGTAPAESIKGGAYIAGIFSKLPNCISIISTHHDILTNLEKTTHGAYKNYKVSAILHKDGSVDPLYTWEPGINQIQSATDLMREEGLTDEYGTSLSKLFEEKMNEKH